MEVGGPLSDLPLRPKQLNEELLALDPTSKRVGDEPNADAC